jgi:hypothetical protein
MTPEDFETRVESLVMSVKPILAGHDPAVQGGALADLTALWLAGHQAGEDSDAVREDLLDMFIDYVRQLIPVNLMLIEEQLQAEKESAS